MYLYSKTLLHSCTVTFFHEVRPSDSLQKLIMNITEKEYFPFSIQKWGILHRNNTMAIHTLTECPHWLVILYIDWYWASYFLFHLKDLGFLWWTYFNIFHILIYRCKNLRLEFGLVYDPNQLQSVPHRACMLPWIVTADVLTNRYDSFYPSAIILYHSVPWHSLCGYRASHPVWYDLKSRRDIWRVLLFDNYLQTGLCWVFPSSHVNRLCSYRQR